MSIVLSKISDPSRTLFVATNISEDMKETLLHVAKENRKKFKNLSSSNTF